MRRAGSVSRWIEDGIYFMEQMWHRRSSQAGISGKRCYGALLNREKERRVQELAEDIATSICCCCPWQRL